MDANKNMWIYHRNFEDQFQLDQRNQRKGHFKVPHGHKKVTLPGK